MNVREREVFVTVGAQMPFDRLVSAVDEWAGRNPTMAVFAQVGSTRYHANNIECAPFLDPEEFYKKVRQADLIVSHAGMGSIITALQYGTPILVMPRRAAYRETRNDHQVATVEKFGRLKNIFVAMNEGEAVVMLDQLRITDSVEPISAYASAELLNTIRSFIRGSGR